MTLRAHRRSSPGEGLGAVLRLYVRLTRRTSALLALVVVGYIALEVASYRTAYPDGVSPVQFEVFKDNPAVRLLNGVPAALDSAGGFTVWDAGWLMQIVLAVWAVVTTGRLLRGEEDVDRADLVLAAPVRAPAVSAVVVAVVAAESLLVGLAAAVALGLSGQSWRGAALFGIGLAAVGCTFSAATAVVAQLVDVRRRVVAVGMGLLGAAYVVRMAGSSADSRLWLRWLTPMGWVDELGPFGSDDPAVLIPIVVVPTVLGLVGVRLRAERDSGGALLARESSGRSRLRLLSSPLAFAWRTGRGALIGWAAGLAAFAAVMGALVGTMIDWIAGDEGYQQILATMGLDEALTIKGFVGFLAFAFCLAIGVHLAFRVGVARTEEESGRLDAVLARPVGRLRWLGGHVLLSAAGALGLTAVVGISMWAGARLAGSSALTLSDTLRSSLNTLPVVALVGGLSVALFGLLPRLTVAVPTTLAPAGFVLYLLGPALEWPPWALDLSPFTHLAMVPAEPWRATGALVMTGLAAGLVVVGALGFRLRDISSG
ncbi:MAG TPA: hypothetical protein VHO26_02170 [Propionibacteriaceae bacterium]|nr:hypothetical protein [Propionibacteriaceae bacterium]